MSKISALTGERELVTGDRNWLKTSRATCYGLVHIFVVTVADVWPQFLLSKQTTQSAVSSVWVVGDASVPASQTLAPPPPLTVVPALHPPLGNPPPPPTRKIDHVPVPYVRRAVGDVVSITVKGVEHEMEALNARLRVTVIVLSVGLSGYVASDSHSGGLIEIA